MSQSASGIGRRHIVQQGESVESIALSTGFLWRTLWDHPLNQDLKARRKDPHVLMPGDGLIIPALRLRELHTGTESRHRVTVKREMSRLRVRFLKNGHARASLAYTLTIDDVDRKGSTDGNGMIDEVLSPAARRARLHFDEDPPEATYVLEVRHLNPITDLSGIQMRLRNLGYKVGALTGKLEQSTRAALAAFQHDQGLRVTGEPDTATVGRLEQVHRS